MNALDHLSPERRTALVETARALQCAARNGSPQRLLHGRRFGLLSGAVDSGPALRFRRAAVELGAEVTDLAPVTAGVAPSELESTAHLLGRLYDAIACEGLEPSLARRLADSAAVPVYRDLASEGPATALASHLDDAFGNEEQRGFLLQAVLLETAL